jgi:hypothetical protein
LLAIAALTNSSSAQAEAIPFNGHYYEFIQLNDDISWTNARAAALSTTSKGKCGYLVNITSAGHPYRHDVRRHGNRGQ